MKSEGGINVNLVFIKNIIHEIIKMWRNLLKVFLIFFLSLGWLIPFFLSYYFLYQSFDLKNSFPFKQYAWYLFILSFAWMSFALILWFVKCHLLNNKINNIKKKLDEK